MTLEVSRGRPRNGAPDEGADPNEEDLDTQVDVHAEGDPDEGRGVQRGRSARPRTSARTRQRASGSGGGMPPPELAESSRRYTVAAKAKHLHDFVQRSMTLRAF